MTTVTDRALRAREALRHAELRTGARSMPVPVPVPVSAPGVDPGVSPGSSPGQRPSLLRSMNPAASPATNPAASPAANPATGPASQGRGRGRTGHPDRPPLPVSSSLAHLLPEGALHRGGTLVVTGSTSLLLALVARASQEGSWVSVVGLPGVGVLAAQQAGVDLDRLALVPCPGPDAPTVLAALIDGVDLVIVGAAAALMDSDRRRLMARAREHGTVLLSTVPWAGAHLVLTAEPAGWTGLGVGHGHLRSHRLTVTRQGRGSAGRLVRTEIVLPVREHAGAPIDPLRRLPAGSPGAPPLRLVG